MDGMTLAIIVIIGFLVLLALGLPVGFAFVLVGLVGHVALGGWRLAANSTSSTLFHFIASYSLSVIPVFILMGNLIAATGILSEIFDVAERWFGGTKRAVGYAAVVANVVFGACSGSSIAACIVIGKSALPKLRARGYPWSLASAIICCSGTLSSIIPPSIGAAIYATVVDQSVGKVLIAGIFPGLLQAAFYMIIIFFWAGRIKVTTTEVIKYNVWENVRFTRHLWPVLIIVGAIIGAIYLGIATPTEAGAVGAVAVFVLALALKRINGKVLKSTIVDTSVVTGMLFFIMATASVFSRFLVLSGATEGIVTFVKSLAVNRWVVFSLIVFIYLVLGCFMSATTMMLITLPIFYPIVVGLGWDPIWFGVIVITLCEIAVVTPPVGVNLYATQGLDPSLPMGQIWKGVWPFVASDLARIGVLSVFPMIALYLPSHM